MIKRNRLIASTLAVLTIVSSGYGIEANAVTTSLKGEVGTAMLATGWIKGVTAEGKLDYCYYENAIKVTGEHEIDNNYYMFGEDGHMLTNVWVANGKVVDSETGKHDSSAFFYNDKGTRASGGVIVPNLVTNNGWVKGVTASGYPTWYFYENGNKIVGEHSIGNNSYVFDEDGHMLTDVWTVNGKVTDNLAPQYAQSTHYYDCNGIQARGWCRMEKSYIEGRGDWMYFDKNGIQQKGWVIFNNNSYYMDMTSGYLKTGWLKLDTTWFYLDKNGKERTGWVYDNGSWYYMNRNGVMQTGWQKIDGKWYFLKSNGAMKTGWLKNAGSWFYLANNGVMKTGWVKDEANWYFLYSNGIMAENSMIGSYHVNASGVWDN